MVRRVLELYGENPQDWKNAWKKITLECGIDAEGQKAAVSDEFPSRHVTFAGIDVRLNGAYVLIGYLWGNGDMAKTMEIATRCGADSDCNPSSACGVLAASMGAKALDEKYISRFDKSRKWEFTDYDWPALLAVCEKLARKIVLAEGGRAEKDAKGNEWFVIPVKDPQPSALVTAQKPSPLPDDVRYTDAEKSQIRYRPTGSCGAQSEPVIR